ncbi:TIM barrel protein [Kribbella solani]|uniref:sugar phosphate isomerase/epimerase family protein n=1 Tax=Kribbella solani TaxID=236067 RepID=UPI0029B8CA0F|nr:TIM barrel protein [Kribbella solani]MDX2968917.1 TIM barrel protein [Kribbella solani]MDX3001322.1 TIM barrel protein [Kribbella solani]
MRLGFATLGCPGAPLDDVVELAQSNNFTGLELRAAPEEFTHVGLTAAERRTLRTRIEDAGLEIFAISSYVRLCAVEEQPLEAHLELAADLGARGVRVFPGDDPGTSPADAPSPGELRALDRVTSVPKDVPILLETHDSHSTARQVAAFCAVLDTDAPGHPVKALWDSSHTWSHGEALAESYALLRPWLEIVQFKQADSRQEYRPVALDAGDFPIRELVHVLDGTDYPLSLEWELKWHPQLPALAEALPAVHAWLAGDPER